MSNPIPVEREVLEDMKKRAKHCGLWDAVPAFAEWIDEQLTPPARDEWDEFREWLDVVLARFDEHGPRCVANSTVNKARAVAAKQQEGLREEAERWRNCWEQDNIKAIADDLTRADAMLNAAGKDALIESLRDRQSRDMETVRALRAQLRASGPAACDRLADRLEKMQPVLDPEEVAREFERAIRLKINQADEGREGAIQDGNIAMETHFADVKTGLHRALRAIQCTATAAVRDLIESKGEEAVSSVPADADGGGTPSPSPASITEQEIAESRAAYEDAANIDGGQVSRTTPSPVSPGAGIVDPVCAFDAKFGNGVLDANQRKFMRDCIDEARIVIQNQTLDALGDAANAKAGEAEARARVADRLEKMQPVLDPEEIARVVEAVIADYWLDSSGRYPDPIDQIRQALRVKHRAPLLPATYVGDEKSQMVYMTDDEMAAHFRAVAAKQQEGLREEIGFLTDVRNAQRVTIRRLSALDPEEIARVVLAAWYPHDPAWREYDNGDDFDRCTAAVRDLIESKGEEGAPEGNDGERGASGDVTAAIDSPPSPASTGAGIVEEWCDKYGDEPDEDKADLARRIDEAMGSVQSDAVVSINNHARQRDEARARVAELEQATVDALVVIRRDTATIASLRGAVEEARRLFTNIEMTGGASAEEAAIRWLREYNRNEWDAARAEED